MAARDVEDRAGLAEMEQAHAQINAATRHAEALEDGGYSGLAI